MVHVGDVHPQRSKARVLLSSVFGPFARDDEYGSRAVNPMELYHNQVTRTQGVFSLRMFHRSWGLMLIQANIDAPCTLLDFPSLDRFTRELRGHDYDVVGISAIQPNLAKLRKMCALVRQYQPRASIVVGGHVTGLADLSSRVDADYFVRGEGAAWFRHFLGEDERAPMRHPVVLSALRARTMGVPLSERPAETAAVLVPSVGCPMGCNFCATSAMFGGKGRSITFYESGDELFDVMCGLAQATGSSSFFIMDENFLLYRRRALRLLERMREAGKSWSLYVFSSANTLRLYSVDELVGLGVSWVWTGLEGKDSGYVKLRGSDTRGLVRNLQAHGIRVLGSSIIGLPEHSAETIDDAIDHAVSHGTEFHQFMLYTPLPGTPLYEEHVAQGTILPESECDIADVHGQDRFNFRHPRIAPGDETPMLLRAFQRDFEEHGPSVLRIARTLLSGWRNHKDDADARVRARYRRECRGLGTMYPGALRAAEWWLAAYPRVTAKLRAVRKDIVTELGWRARLLAPVVAAVVWTALWREDRRLRRGATDEPPTLYEGNPAARAINPTLAACRWVKSHSRARRTSPSQDACAPGAAHHTERLDLVGGQVRQAAQ